MIDTIHISIDLHRYVELEHNILKKLKTKFANVKTSEAPYLNINVYDYGKDDVTGAKGFLTLPSSIYNIAAMYNRSRHKLDLNISVPKYLKGHNVYQLIVDPTAKSFSPKHNSITGQLKYSFHLLRSFLSILNRQLFYGKLKEGDVTIKRIDFCYNLYFDNETDLDYYFEALRNVKKKYERDDTNAASIYKNSIFYKGKGHSFKIYKKGKEFKKTTFKEVFKANPDYANKLQKIANRILRYEMTVRELYINRIYKTYLFRKNCPVWKRIKGEIVFEVEKRSKLGNYYKVVRKNSPEEEKQRKSAMGKSCRFKLSIDPEDQKSNTITDNNIPNTALYSERLHLLLLGRFLKYINTYKVTYVDRSRMDELRPGIKDYATIKKILRLTRKYTLEQLLDMGVFSRRSYYNYKKIFKKNRLDNPYLNVPLVVKFDYSTYFTDFHYLINVNKFVDKYRLPDVGLKRIPYKFAPVPK